jgi:hypothetical protein
MTVSRTWLFLGITRLDPLNHAILLKPAILRAHSLSRTPSLA